MPMDYRHVEYFESGSTIDTSNSLFQKIPMFTSLSATTYPRDHFEVAVVGQ
jgi:hypothetical protein